jgi:hypothetical protein
MSESLVPIDAVSHDTASAPQSSALDVADGFLTRATGADEALAALQVRAEVLRQDREHNEHKLKLWRAQQNALRARRRDLIDVGLQAASLFTGSAMVFLGHEWIGGFIAAAGIYRIAKEFVLRKFPSAPNRIRDDE